MQCSLDSPRTPGTFADDMDCRYRCRDYPRCHQRGSPGTLICHEWSDTRGIGRHIRPGVCAWLWTASGHFRLAQIPIQATVVRRPDHRGGQSMRKIHVASVVLNELTPLLLLQLQQSPSFLL